MQIERVNKMTTESKNFKKTLTGVVVSDKADKTIAVKVERKLMHKKYSKFIKLTKKYHAHDEKNVAKIGDKVTIIESRPYSKLKKWELLSVQA
jgi:small subunit ribosomal protein S17